MNDNQSIKNKIYQHLMHLMEEKIKTAHKAVDIAKESRNSETKSSAGDKHETGRAMSQIELDNAEHQLNRLVTLKNQLESIEIDQTNEKVEKGSLIKTNTGIFFISIGIGQITIQGTSYFAISLESPIGMALKHKILGEKFEFQGKEMEILELI